MIEIIPAIIPKDFKELEEKIDLVEPYIDWVQLDIMDSKFVDNATWNNPFELKNLHTNLKLEAHLMIQNPEEHIDEWINSGVKRIIFHYESTEKHQEIIDKIKQAGLEVGIAINPETKAEMISRFAGMLDLILVMTVNPGKGGQKFLDEMLEKIKYLRVEYPYVKIEVDGGINSITASSAIKMGANILVSGSAIFQGNIENNIKILKNYVDKRIR
ncbi:ribulose-phosphate 3-epimerase [Patescibacteria group bacterium]